MTRYFLSLSYDGSRYHGWQRQPNGATVQQTLEDAMTMIMRTPVSLTGAGRTDTGVHARRYYAHFDTDRDFSREERDRLAFKLNSFLPSDISIGGIIPVDEKAHARFSALSRTYRYCIARSKDPFRKNFTHYLYGDIDIPLMNTGAELIMDYRDFTSFSKVDTDTMTNDCRIMAAKWETEGTELVFTITADRFLRNMVRAIVGTLLDLGKGKITPEDVKQIIELKDRSEAGESVPAKGLTLWQVEYPGWIGLSSGQ